MLHPYVTKAGIPWHASPAEARRRRVKPRQASRSRNWPVVPAMARAKGVLIASGCVPRAVVCGGLRWHALVCTGIAGTLAESGEVARQGVRARWRLPIWAKAYLSKLLNQSQAMLSQPPRPRSTRSPRP
jgi:hypothetical protein